MNWLLSHRADPLARPIADRHYNRQKSGAPQFVPPGRCLVFRMAGALWVTSWPFAAYVKHDWAGAWVNSCFRNEQRAVRASALIRDALAATRFYWRPPSMICPHCGHWLSLVTFIDTSKIRQKPDRAWGKCYLKAGFIRCEATTKSGLLVFHIALASLPEAVAPNGSQVQFDLQEVL